MRIVLDTNVLVRVVTSPTGPAAELFELVRQYHRIVISEKIGEELTDVLLRDRIKRLHQFQDVQVHEFVESIMAGASVVSLPDIVSRVVPHDEDDDYVIATAVSGAADVICTWNKHFYHQDVIDYCQQHTIEIMDDPQLLNLLRSEHSQP